MLYNVATIDKITSWASSLAAVTTNLKVTCCKKFDSDRLQNVTLSHSSLTLMHMSHVHAMRMEIAAVFHFWFALFEVLVTTPLAHCFLLCNQGYSHLEGSSGMHRSNYPQFLRSNQLLKFTGYQSAVLHADSLLQVIHGCSVPDSTVVALALMLVLLVTAQVHRLYMRTTEDCCETVSL